MSESREGFDPATIGLMMHNPQHPTSTAAHHLQRALEHAKRLSEERPESFTPAWSAQAAQVGDLSVLLLALRS
jgi:hypothetical protein